METLTTFLSLFISASAMIFIYSLKRAGNNFIFTVWILENRQKFYMCLCSLGFLALGLNFVPFFQNVFAIVGLGTSGTSLAMLGAAVGGLTVGVMRARK